MAREEGNGDERNQKLKTDHKSSALALCSRKKLLNAVGQIRNSFLAIVLRGWM